MYDMVSLFCEMRIRTDWRRLVFSSLFFSSGQSKENHYKNAGGIKKKNPGAG